METLLRALESVEASLYSEIIRADGSGTHLRPLIAVASEAIVAAGGDSLWARCPFDPYKRESKTAETIQATILQDSGDTARGIVDQMLTEPE